MEIMKVTIGQKCREELTVECSSPINTQHDPTAKAQSTLQVREKIVSARGPDKITYSYSESELPSSLTMTHTDGSKVYEAGKHRLFSLGVYLVLVMHTHFIIIHLAA